MINLVVEEKYNGKKLDRFLLDKFKKLSFNEFNKALRRKDIRVNNKRTSQNIFLFNGDKITLYIKDEILYGIPKLDIIYEDENILIVNKPQGINVEKQSSEICIMDIVQNYYKEESNIIPKPCHRLDRNTGGLLIIAKNIESQRILLEKFKSRQIEKYYLATVYGIPKIKEQILTAYLFKDSKKKQVYISDFKKPKYLPITTEYTILEENVKNNTCVLEVRLITGRTHQIRAHLAHLGYPIIGDRKIWSWQNK